MNEFLLLAVVVVYLAIRYGNPTTKNLRLQEAITVSLHL
jgi:hypothetical protein